MYGIVNKALQNLVLSEYGQDTWEKIKQHSGVDIGIFVGAQTYPDEVTYKLATAASELLQLDLNTILHTFGEYWATETAMKEYPELMESGGSNLFEFLENLPNFHAQIVLMMPKLKPPEFQCSEVTENSLLLHYYSDRPGLAPFVQGILVGLGKVFDTPVKITQTHIKENESDHDIFRIQNLAQ